VLVSVPVGPEPGAEPGAAALPEMADVDALEDWSEEAGAVPAPELRSLMHDTPAH
jgi:hypothetical protein